ncbi:MAG: hypothetical protein ACOX61_05445 [Brooklawnia sp.]|jgi:hypothetical protein
MTRSAAPGRRSRRRYPGWVGLILVVLLLVNLAVNPWLARHRSLAVMSGYDWWHQRNSVARDAGVHIDMPLRDGGLFPMLVTYNADEAMSAWLGEPVRFTVEFSFGDFDGGHSTIFEPDHRLYGAYVGAYHLQGLGHAPSARQIGMVAEFDQRILALPALGLPSTAALFEIEQQSPASPVSFAGQEWTSHDAQVLTNCPDHSSAGFSPADLQFGRPPQTSAHYPLCRMTARIDVAYLAEHDLGIGLFIMATDADVVERLSSQVVRRAELVAG